MLNEEILLQDLELQNLIEIGYQISTELNSVSKVLKDNLEDISIYFSDFKYKSSSFNKPIIDFVLEKIEASEDYIELFESELELISNYDRSNKMLNLNNNLLEKLKLSDNLNLYQRVELEVFISNLEKVREIVEEITSSLSKQNSDKFMISRLIM